MNGVIVIILFGVLLAVPLVILGVLNTELFFLKFDLNKHPKILKLLEDTVNTIVSEENITVFNKDFKEINKNEPDQNKWAVGQYIYTNDADYKERNDEFVCKIREFEKRHHDYETFAIEAEEHTIPRIVLCKDYEINTFGIAFHYATFLHELGHHFANKNMGAHNEDDANRYANELVLARLPRFYQLFISWHFTHEFDLPRKTQIKCWISYLKFKLTK